MLEKPPRLVPRGGFFYPGVQETSLKNMAYHGALRDIMNSGVYPEQKNNGDLPERISAGLSYLRSLDRGIFASYREGFRETAPIRGKDLYAVHQIYRAGPSGQARFEIHRKYIDLQYVWSGAEDIYVVPLRELRPLGPYSSRNDIRFYGAQDENGGIRALLRRASRLRMEEGSLAVFFPRDAHAPAVSCGEKMPVVKTVVKVRI